MKLGKFKVRTRYPAVVDIHEAKVKIKQKKGKISYTLYLEGEKYDSPFSAHDTGNSIILSPSGVEFNYSEWEYLRQLIVVEGIFNARFIKAQEC